MATFLKDSFAKNQPTNIHEIRDAVVEGGKRRIRPAVMTTATTLLALLPILTSTGRGADIMLPMAIPVFGGMLLQTITMFTVPILFALWHEWAVRIKNYKAMIQQRIYQFLLLLAGLPFNGYAQTLDELLSLARNQNPTIKVFQLESKAILEQATAVGQLSDPQLNFGVFPLPVETRLGAQIIGIGARQQLPWFGMLKARKDYQSKKAAVTAYEADKKFLSISHQIRQAYFQLYELNQKQELYNQRIDLLLLFKQTILSRVENGSTNLADAILIQLKIDELKQEIPILENAKSNPVSTINHLLNRPVNTPIVIEEKLEFAAEFNGLDSLQSFITQNHPAIKQLTANEAVVQQRLAIHSLENKPQFQVGVNYTMVDRRSVVNLEGNGRDILQISGGISLPLNPTRYQSKKQTEQFHLEALGQQQGSPNFSFGRYRY